MVTARDVMNTQVVGIPEDCTVEEAGRLLVRSGVSGVPVFDRDGALVGIISEYQLLELVYNPKLKSQPVSQFMTRQVITVAEDDPVDRLAGFFVLNRIRRLPVVKDGRVVGMITRRDLLKRILADVVATGA